jgi:pimeloyl-ACP methyl ester carboxylesterase
MKLYFREMGQGGPLFFLHGLLGSGDNWLFIARKLACRFHCVLPDMRNHGSSPWSAPFTYREMADDVMELADSLNIKQFSVLGHSMGAKVAMTCALVYSDRIEALISADMAPRRYSGDDLKRIVNVLYASDLSGLRFRADVEALISGGVPQAHVRAFLLKSLAERDGKFSWKFNLESIRDSFGNLGDWTEAGTVFQKPTLFLAGERSRYLGDEDYPEIRKFFPGAGIVTVPEAGHWLHTDNPRFVIQSIEEFFR